MFVDCSERGGYDPNDTCRQSCMLKKAKALYEGEAVVGPDTFLEFVTDNTTEVIY